MNLGINCPVCSCIDFDLRLDDINVINNKIFKVYTCCNCGLGITVPQPDPDELSAYYKDYYTEKHRGETLNTKERLKIMFYRGLTTKNKFLYSFCFFLIKQTMQIILPKPSGNKRVLDVGCGWGRLLDYFKMQGYETYGIEPGPLSSQLARERGHKIFTGELIDIKYPNDYFVAIVFCHSLEHIRNPVEVLNEAYRILTPGGILVVEVPNFNCADASFFRNAWIGLQVPFHLYHWTPISLATMLSKIGFKIILRRFKNPTCSDFKMNLKNLRQQTNTSYLKAFIHFVIIWILGHLGIKKNWTGHFMTFYSTK